MKTAVFLMAFMIALSGFAAEKKYEVELVYSGKADKVNVPMDINKWNKESNTMTKNADGNFSLKLNLSPGRYEYKFVVNGKDWKLDESNPYKIKTGKYTNSLLMVGEKKKVMLTYKDPTAAKVCIAMDINHWDKKGFEMKKDGNGLFTYELELVPGKYFYKFVVDGKMKLDPNAPKEKLGKYEDSVLVIK